MAGVIKNKFGDLMLACWESVAIMFDNFLTGIAEEEKLKYNEEVRLNLQAIATRHMPFFDKIDELKMMVSQIGGPEDDALRNRLMLEIDHIGTQGMEVKQGMEEVKKVFENSNLSKKDKNRAAAEIARCERTLQNFYSITIPAHSYKKFMALVRTGGAQHDITVMELSNGQYTAFYPAQHKSLMEDAMEIATLSYQQHPSVSAVERSSYFGSVNKERASVLRFENIPKTLAEKAVLEANFCSYVNFAKELQPGSNPPLYNLVCEGGETQEERDRNYLTAMEILTRSALAVSGPLKDQEEQKMNFYSNRQQHLEEGLQSGNGYIYTVKTSSDDRNRIIPNEYIRFETDPISQNGQFFVHVNGVNTTTVYESETDRYADQLYHMSQAGTGEKLYISSERMEKLKETASNLYGEIQKSDKAKDSLTYGEALFDKVTECSKYKKSGQKEMYQVVAQERRQIEAIQNACIIFKKKDKELTKKEILDGVLSVHLKEHGLFRSRTDGVIAQGGMLIQNMARWCAQETRNESDHTSHNYLRCESKNGVDDYSVDSMRLLQELDRLNPNSFISYELNRAVRQDEKKSDHDITKEEALEEKRLIETYYPETLEKAKELLHDVRIRMISAEIPVEMRDLKLPFTQYNSIEIRAALQRMNHREQEPEVEIQTKTEEQKREREKAEKDIVH